MIQYCYMYISERNTFNVLYMVNTEQITKVHDHSSTEILMVEYNKTLHASLRRGQVQCTPVRGG